MNGVERIAAERLRQIREEGHDACHDDRHHAAAAYAAPLPNRRTDLMGVPFLWPWRSSDWKPTPKDRIRELAKAGALIAAEIDRIQRLPELPQW